MINPIDINMTMYNLQGKNLENLDRYASLKASKNGKDERDEALRKAASDFEAVFVGKLLEIMDSTVEKSDFLRGGQAENTFKSMLNQEIAKNIASDPASSFGFAEQIYQQMKNGI